MRKKKRWLQVQQLGFSLPQDKIEENIKDSVGHLLTQGKAVPDPWTEHYTDVQLSAGDGPEYLPKRPGYEQCTCRPI